MRWDATSCRKRISLPLSVPSEMCAGTTGATTTQLHVARPGPAAAAAALTNGGGGGGHLSLRRLAVWLAEPTQRMRLLMVLAEATHGKKVT